MKRFHTNTESDVVSEDVTPKADPLPPPHPFARELAFALAGHSTARVLLLGIGNGRNVTPFIEAGVRVDAVEDDPDRARAAAVRYAANATIRVARAPYAGPYPFAGGCAAALSTSALLHGRADGVARAIAAVRARLEPDAPFFCTLGSTNDPRYGVGRRVADDTFAPDSGSEAGVAHAYFDEPRLRALFAGFHIDDATDGSAAATAGAWAHSGDEAERLVHWFVRARRA